MIRSLLMVQLIILLTLCASAAPITFEYKLNGTLPKLIFNNQKQLELHFDPSRVAIISSIENTNNLYNIKLTFKANSCSEIFKEFECLQQSWISAQMLTPIWTQHPDLKKIGMPVTPLNNESSNVMSMIDWSFNFWNSEQRKNFLSLPNLKNASPTTLKCQNTTWWPATKFEEISFEALQHNRETNLMQNRVVKTMRDVAFIKVNDTLKITSMQKFRMDNIAVPNLLIANFASETIKFVVKKKSQLCEYTAERDTNKNIFFEKIFNKTDKFKPLEFESAETARKQLIRIFKDELALGDSALAKGFEQFPATVQILQLFNLTKIKVSHSNPDFYLADVQLLEPN